MEMLSPKSEVLIEMYEALPKAAELLDTNVENIAILPGRINSDYQKDSTLSDISVQHVCLFSDSTYYTSPIGFHKNDPWAAGGRLGLFVMKTRDSGIKYIHYQALTEDGNPVYRTFTRKDTLFKFFRHINKQKCEVSRKRDTRPILDEALLDEIVECSVNFLRGKRTYGRYGVKVKKGLMFLGAPGNGKTMLCRYLRALGNSMGINSNTCNVSVIEHAFNHQNLDSLMNFDGMLFIDDIDSSYFDRNGPRSNLASALLSAISGLDTSNNTVRIFTSNEEINHIDDAFQRAGRIDKVFKFDLPIAALRRRFIQTWPKDMLEKVDIDALVDSTEEWSFAQIDLVKTVMVQHFLRDKVWDADLAVEQVITRLDGMVRDKKKVGFK